MSLFTKNLAWSLIVLLPGGSPCSNPDLPQRPSPRETVLERFTLAKDSKMLFLPVDLQGKKYNFAVDTGATTTCYDESLRSFLGRPIYQDTAHTNAGDRKVTFFVPPTAKLGRIDLPRYSLVCCVDFGVIRDMSKQEIYGLLGMDLLKDHILRIDFERAEVSFLRSAGSDPGERIPITFERNVPKVEVTFPGLREREKFIVDTGYVGREVNLRAELFDVLAKGGFVKAADDEKFETISGSGSCSRGHIQAISLGNHCHKNLLCGRVNVNSLCLHYWCMYSVVTFDFPHKAIYLKKKKPKGEKKEG